MLRRRDRIPGRISGRRRNWQRHHQHHEQAGHSHHQQQPAENDHGNSGPFAQLQQVDAGGDAPRCKAQHKNGHDQAGVARECRRGVRNRHHGRGENHEPGGKQRQPRADEDYDRCDRHTCWTPHRLSLASLATRAVAFRGVYTTASDVWQLCASCDGLIRVGLKQREHNYPGDGDVQPDGKGITRDTFMLREAAAEREEERDEHQRQCHH